MRHTMTDFPIGARWEVVTDEGKHGAIYLEKRSEYLEMWMWCTWSSDRTTYKSDWNPSYKLCREEIPLWNANYKPLRFRRVK